MCLWVITVGSSRRSLQGGLRRVLLAPSLLGPRLASVVLTTFADELTFSVFGTEVPGVFSILANVPGEVRVNAAGGVALAEGLLGVGLAVVVETSVIADNITLLVEGTEHPGSASLLSEVNGGGLRRSQRF